MPAGSIRRGAAGPCYTEYHLKLGEISSYPPGYKENGSVFSHMAVMYANALYRRGFVKEGWKALKTLADTALNFDTSHIYPGIPEYFRSDGRGMYHYLTGAASWYMMTMITEVFGVHGESGDLILYPKLLAEQFDSDGNASITVPFAGKCFTIVYKNTEGKDFGACTIGSALCGQTMLPVCEDSFAVLTRESINALPDHAYTITVELI